MANPSEASVQTQIGTFIKVLDEMFNYASENTENFIADRDGVVTGLDNDFSAGTSAGLATIEAGLSALLDGGTDLTDSGFLAYAKQQDFPEMDIQQIFTRLQQSFIDNSESVDSREFTYGTPTADGGNVGDAILSRLTTDQFAQDIENATPEAKIVTCTSDANSGATKHAEVYEIRGAAAFKNNLDVTGSGEVGAIISATTRDTQAFVSNPSFSSFQPAASPPVDVPAGSLTALTDWTPIGSATDFSNLSIDVGETYRDIVGQSPAALGIGAADGVKQKFSVVQAQFNPLIPYYVQIAYNRADGAFSGTLQLTFGDQAVSVVLAAQTGWNVLRIVLDESSWYDVFNATDPGIEIEVTAFTSGTLLVDDVIVAPMTLHDGTWYALVGGQTPSLIDDEFTFADTALEAAILQFWFWRLYDRYLPHNSAGAETWADPT